jgi:hypothetical protein
VGERSTFIFPNKLPPEASAARKWRSLDASFPLNKSIDIIH